MHLTESDGRPLAGRPAGSTEGPTAALPWMEGRMPQPIPKYLLDVSSHITAAIQILADSDTDYTTEIRNLNVVDIAITEAMVKARAEA